MKNVKIPLIFLIILCAIFFIYRKESFNRIINKNYDFICILPPYTPTSEAAIDLKKYADNFDLKKLGYQESNDDGIFTFALIWNKKIILTGTDYIKNNSLNKYGCFEK